MTTLIFRIVFMLFAFFPLSGFAKNFVCPISFANSTIENLDKIKHVYREVFESEQVYKLGSCNTNIYNFLKVLKACEISLPKSSKVIYLSEQDLNLILSNTREGKRSWYFHVILDISGETFDFDDLPSEKFNNNRKNYFSRQFSEHKSKNFAGITFYSLKEVAIPSFLSPHI